MESVTNSRSPPTPKSDKSFWILLVSVIVIVIILIVVLTMCNKPCNCKDKSCKGTCVPDETPCKLDNDCTFFGERCVGPSNQNYTPPGNCKLSNAKCSNDGNCLNNMYCADPQNMPNPIDQKTGKQGVCYNKTLCKYEAQQATDPCKTPTECNVDIGSSLSTTGFGANASAGSGPGTWILKGASTNSKPANGTYTISGTGNSLTVNFVVSNVGSGFFPNDITKNLNTTLQLTPGTGNTIPTITTPPAFTLSPPSTNARGYCEFPKPPAQLNSQSHTLRGASHSSY